MSLRLDARRRVPFVCEHILEIVPPNIGDLRETHPCSDENEKRQIDAAARLTLPLLKRTGRSAPPRAHALRAVCQLLNDEFEASSASFREALRLDPDDRLISSRARAAKKLRTLRRDAKALSTRRCFEDAQLVYTEMLLEVNDAGCFATATSATPLHAKLYAARAEATLRAGRPADALPKQRLIAFSRAKLALCERSVEDVSRDTFKTTTKEPVLSLSLSRGSFLSRERERERELAPDAQALRDCARSLYASTRGAPSKKKEKRRIKRKEKKKKRCEKDPKFLALFREERRESSRDSRGSLGWISGESPAGPSRSWASAVKPG